MGLTFLVFDKKRKYTSTVGNILDITGHKLLVALNEDKVKELLGKVPVDIFLMEFDDVCVWLDNLEASNYAKPIFFLNEYEQAEQLLRLGFSERNFVVLPFNPLDLLSNAAFISKQTAQIVDKGFVNALLDVLRYKLSANLEIDNKCVICVENGSIRGYTCSDDELLDAVSGIKPTVKLFPYGEDLVLHQTVKSNSDIFRVLIHKSPDYKQERTEILPFRMDGEVYTKPIEIMDGVLWMGSFDKDSVLQTNTILRLYKKGATEIPILINIGGQSDYLELKNKLERVLGSVENLKALVVMGVHSDEHINVYNFARLNPKLHVITTLSIARELYRLNLPMSRIKPVEYLYNGVLRLATGDLLRFLHTPFCPGRGSFIVYEDLTGLLYTSYLFSSYASSVDLNRNMDVDLDSLKIFHTLNMPSGKAMKNALDMVKGLKVKTILPRYGNVIWDPEQAIKALEGVQVGVSALKVGGYDTLSVVKDIIKGCRFWLSDREFSSFLQVISRYVYVSEDLNEIESYVDVEFLPSILLTNLMFLGVRGELALNLIKFLYSKGLLNFSV